MWGWAAYMFVKKQKLRLIKRKWYMNWYMKRLVALKSVHVLFYHQGKARKRSNCKTSPFITVLQKTVHRIPFDNEQIELFVSWRFVSGRIDYGPKFARVSYSHHPISRYPITHLSAKSNHEIHGTNNKYMQQRQLDAIIILFHYDSSTCPLQVLGPFIMVVIRHGSIHHELLFLGLASRLIRKDTVRTMVSVGYGFPQLLAHFFNLCVVEALHIDSLCTRDK